MRKIVLAFMFISIGGMFTSLSANVRSDLKAGFLSGCISKDGNDLNAERDYCTCVWERTTYDISATDLDHLDDENSSLYKVWIKEIKTEAQGCMDRYLN